MFGIKNTPADLTAVVEQGVEALNTKHQKLAARKDLALSAFRSTANELAAVNTEMQETVDIAQNMAEYFATRKATAEKAIADNEAVRQKILDIIGE